MTKLSDIRAFYATLMAASSGSTDPRLERIFAMVPREAFLPPGPWTVMAGGRPIETPSDDPGLLYQNVLVALDRTRGINNGEPFLHAAWIGRVLPQPGEIVSHVGAGTGYFSAILSMLVLPAGKVYAYEIERSLAGRARANLEPFENVEVFCGDATTAEVAEVIDALWDGPETVVVVSSDLSHYLPYDAAREVDRATADRILRLDPDPVVHDEACGATPVNGLVLAARRRGLVPELVALGTSGDAARSRPAGGGSWIAGEPVVGYGAFAFYEAE